MTRLDPDEVARLVPTGGPSGVYLTTTEAAERLGIDEKTVRRFVKEGRLAAYPRGARFRFDLDEVDALVVPR